MDIQTKKQEWNRECEKAFERARMPKVVVRQDQIDIKGLSNFYNAVHDFLQKEKTAQNNKFSESVKRKMSGIGDLEAYFVLHKKHLDGAQILNPDRNDWRVEADTRRCSFRVEREENTESISEKQKIFDAAWAKLSEEAEKKGVNFIEIADDA